MKILKAEIRPEGYVALYAQNPDRPQVCHWVYAAAGDGGRWSFTHSSEAAIEMAEGRRTGYDGLAMDPLAVDLTDPQPEVSSG